MRPFNCNALKFGDDGTWLLGYYWRDPDHCGPIFFLCTGGSFNSNFDTNKWISNFANWWYSQRLTDEEHNSEYGLRLGYIVNNISCVHAS